MASTSPRAFFSCRFTDTDEHVISYFKTIARVCDVEPVLAGIPSVRPVPDKVRELIRGVDCLVAIITPSAVSDRTTSAWINQEIGMAFALGIPLIPFVENTVEDLGLISIAAEFVRFDRTKLEVILEKALNYFNSVKSTIVARTVTALSGESDASSKLEKYSDLYDSRLMVNLPAKQRIAAFVLQNILQGSVSGIMLDSGTVTYSIAEALIESGRRIPIVTNNLFVVDKFPDILHYPVHVLTGDWDPRTRAAGGHETAIEATRYLTGEMDQKIDYAFLAANSIDPDLGISADAPIFSEFRAAMLRHAKNVVVVMQGEKFLKSVSDPVLPTDEWRAILQKRSAESSMWVICHKLAGSYGVSAEARYGVCAACFAGRLPPGHFVELD